MDNWIMPKDRNINISEYGNKAFGLNKLIFNGFNVPPCVFISSRFLWEIIINKNKDEYLSLKTKYNDFNKMTAIKEWIQGLEKDEEIINFVDDVFNQLTTPLTIRSSADIEDGNEQSFAGLFKTYTNLFNSKTIVEAIYSVFASQFSQTIKDRDINMGIIIQEYIDADIKGVAFSNNPLTGDEELYIEYTNIKEDSIVDGDEVKTLIYKDEMFIYKTEDENIIPVIILTELCENINKIEKVFGYPVDVEWLIKNNTIYIVQARPISTVLKKHPDTSLYIDSLDIDQIQSFNLGDMREKHERYQEKHYKIRKLCYDLGLRFPQVGYLFYRKSQLTKQKLEELLFEANVYKVVSVEKTRTISKKGLFDYLISLSGKDNQIVRIQEITLTHACGNVAMIQDNDFYIEAIPGGFGGFLFGELPFSWYKVNEAGKILDLESYYYNKYWSFDNHAYKFKEKYVDDFQFVLNNNIIQQLIQIASKISKSIKNVSIEWELQYNDVYVNDISFGNTRLEVSLNNKGVISLGSIIGEVVVLKDIEPLKAILSGRSIVPEKEFYEASKSDALKNFVISIYPGKDKFVLVTPSAHPSLSLLMNYCSGFIFERGGLLSHLAIILRENKIPARIIENATNIFSTSQYVNL